MFKIDYSNEFNLFDCLEYKLDKSSVLIPTKVEIPSDSEKVCLTVDNVLSSMECGRIVQRSEDAGFRKALVNVGVGEILDSDYRNSDRCIIDDVKFAKALFDRIHSFLPKTIQDKYNQGWELAGLNERMRILRYGKGNFFAQHRDGSYMKNTKEVSLLTLMIYLNDGGGNEFQGGFTNFFDARGSRYEVIPQCGRVLAFQHRLLHEGAEVTKGTKYVIRTDVMYRKTIQDD